MGQSDIRSTSILPVCIHIWYKLVIIEITVSNSQLYHQNAKNLGHFSIGEGNGESMFDNTQCFIEHLGV